MCGFVGVVDFSGSSVEHRAYIVSALEDLKRRGPDDCGLWQGESGEILGFRRLSIRDLSKNGSQPMHSQSGRYAIAYNGEIYNTAELIKTAKLKNFNFRSTSDTEILLEAIENIGLKKSLEIADGIFALVLVDKINKKVYLARDHAGIKPLYFGINDSGLVFSSHYHHITSHKFFNNQNLNCAALSNYFRYGFVQEGEGLLNDTYFMPHGHIAEIDFKGNWSWKPYINFSGGISPENKAISEKEFIKIYKAVVKSQMISDVPLGTLMSGGVDSTLTTAVISEIKANVKAYTISVDDLVLDESDEAARFAGYFNVTHKIKKVAEEEVIDALKQYEDSAAEPLADTGSLIMLKVCEAAKQDLTVVLSGDGGDEIFWGYPRFITAAKYYKYLRLPIIKRTFNIFFERIKGNKIPWRLLKYRGFSDYYLSVQGIPGNSIWVDSLFNKKPSKREPFHFKLINKELKNKSEALVLAKNIEFGIHLQRVLLKVDRASMYHSLEVRTPMLSKRFIELSSIYSFNECVNGSEGKVPLRNALKKFIPSESKNSGIKKGFSPPLAFWLRGILKEKVEDRILNIPVILEPHLNKKTINRIWEEHQNGKDWSWIIWSIYTLFSWVDNKMFKDAC